MRLQVAVEQVLTSQFQSFTNMPPSVQ